MAPVAVSPATSSPGASMPGSPAEEAVATPSTDSSGFSGGPVGGYANGNGNGVHHRNGIDGFVNGHSNGHSANGHGPDGHAPNGHTNGYFASGGGHYGVGGLNIATSPDGFVDSPRTAGTTTAATSPPPSPLPAAAAAAAPLPAHPDPSKPIPIAIIGMACRLPGDVSSPAEFWELCARARTGFSAVPPSTRFDTAAFWHPNPGKAGTMSPEGGNFIKQDPALFDAPFFSMTAQEATSLDPQQRLLLECTFEALENAGIPRHDIVGKDVGVFVGGSFSEYESSLFRDTDYIAMHQATGEFVSFLLAACLVVELGGDVGLWVVWCWKSRQSGRIERNGVAPSPILNKTPKSRGQNKVVVVEPPVSPALPCSERMRKERPLQHHTTTQPHALLTSLAEHAD